MKQLKVGLIVLSAIVTGVTAASATVPGDYLVTFHNQHPAGSFYEPLFVKIVEDASTLGYRTTGTVVLTSVRPIGLQVSGSPPARTALYSRWLSRTRMVPQCLPFQVGFFTTLLRLAD